MTDRGAEDSVITLPRIVIVGGGAGGLELATALGDRLGRRRQAEITLIDANLTHLWKPLLHEVAAATFDSHEDDLDYIAQAHWHHFRFRLGRMDGLDRKRREVRLAPLLDEKGRELTPRRTIPYDILVIAVGGVTNDFGVPGVREHCVYLDERDDADRFQHSIMNNFIRAQTRTAPLTEGQLTVAIIGAGATGVELAAELHHLARQLTIYGFDRIVPERDVMIVIFEAAERILPGLPERLSKASEEELRKLNVAVHTGRRIARVTAEGVYTDDGAFVAAQAKVWAAGIMAPEFLANLDDLETNTRHQLIVHQTLQTTRDERIFALGDCAACPQPGKERPVPPTAQAAHQQATMLVKTIRRYLRGEPLPRYVYRDRGSLISLSHYSTVGNIMGNLIGNVLIEGWFARLTYRLLYRLHQKALHGAARTMFLILADFLTHRTRPRLKLH